MQNLSMMFLTVKRGHINSFLSRVLSLEIQDQLHILFHYPEDSQERLCLPAVCYKQNNRDIFKELTT